MGRGEGRAGYVLMEKTEDGRRLEGTLPVDGAPEKMHSYRTELAGILAILLAIRAVLSESTNSQITGTVYCDNMRAVQRLNELDSNYPTTVTEANEEEHEKRRVRGGMTWEEGVVFLVRHSCVSRDAVDRDANSRQQWGETSR